MQLALVLFLCTIIVAGIHSGASQALTEQDQFDNALDDFDENSRAASASGKVVASGPLAGPVSLNTRNPQPPGNNLPKLVECFACTGCPTANNATTKLCPYSFDMSKQKKCVVYAEKYNHITNPWYIRGCTSERGSCAEIRASHEHRRDLQLLFCTECEGDKCNHTNGAGNYLPDLIVAFIAMIVTPMLTKYTLS